MLSMDDNMMHYRWPTEHITKESENASWINEDVIYKYTLNFIVKVLWSILRNQIIPIDKDNTLYVTSAMLNFAFILGVVKYPTDHYGEDLR